MVSDVYAPPAAGVAKPAPGGDRTRIMPQTTASDVQAPASATPSPTGVTAAKAPAVPSAPISQEQAVFLRARRTALTKQLESVQSRRDEVADVLRNDETQASERPGLQQRLDQLDQRLLQLERDIAANSEQLANAPPEAGSNRDNDGVTVVPRGERPGFLGRANPNTVIFFSFLLLMPVVIRLARRFIAPNRAPSRQERAELAALRARMEQMDGALDAVAVEVERIGEGQRFLTQAMTENLQRPASALGAPAYEPVVAHAREANERR